MFFRFKKVGLNIAVSSLVGLSVLGIFAPEPAKAVVPVGIVADAPKIVDKVEETIYSVIKAAIKNSVVRMVSYAIRKVSYDSAVWLASGGKGQNPLAQVSSPGDYLLNVGNEAGGAFIEELGRGVGGLCKIPDIKLDLAVKIGLRTNFTGSAYGPEGKPSCTLTDFADNWFDKENWKSKYGADQIGKRFNATLSTDNSALGIYGSLNEKIGNRIVSEKANALLERVEAEGFKAKETVGKRIQIPAKLIQEQFKAQTPDKQQKTDQEQLDALLASGDVKVIPAAASIFLNTLVGTMVSNWQNNGILPFGMCVAGVGGAGCDSDKSSGGDIASNSSAQFSSGLAQAQSFFSYLKSVKIDEISNYDILAKLSSCHENPGTYNCRIDDEFVLALRQAETGVPMTIEEAIKKNWLHGNYLLIPPSDENGINSDRECYLKQYCYADAQVLRQLRIMPLGFEIAAKNSNPNNPWTLKQVMDGFYDCPRDVNEFDPKKPFCRLIDPNWVLKAPPAKCNAFVWTTGLLANGATDRMKDCVDVQTCVQYDAQGKCKDYAYCTREKNIWDFSAKECDAQYATCRSFSGANGSVAYLYRTLDTQSCTQENVGCRAYSFSQANGSWLTPGIKSDGTNRGIFFNNKISTSCSANSAGCSAFNIVGNNSEQLFLKKAPDYLKCYDVDRNDGQADIDWPETQADLNRLDPAKECTQYSGACIADEVNCNFYKPTDGGTEIPGRFTPALVSAGQVQWNDQCDEKCVGYAAYREMPNNFSNGQSVVYIIPTTGETCTAQQEGCSAFTNLSGTGEAIEYFAYLRTCAKPGPSVKSKTYVTYEGSVQGGYQLKTFTLVENDEEKNGPIGAPKYYYKTEKDLVLQNKDCDEYTYKSGIAPLDCRQFNDEAGVIYYRLLAYTIPVTDACTDYRLNSPEMYNIDDSTITNRTACEARKGLWEAGNINTTDDDVCRVCFQNGEYREGSCFYQGLPGTITNSAGNSRSCPESVETCRAYKGNAGNNIEVVFENNFENQSTALTGWTGGIVSAESTHVGEHSLQSVAAAPIVRTITAGTSQSYDLSFWAKGSNSVSVRFGTTTKMNEVGVVSLSDSWNFYHVGPFEFNGDAGTAELQFVNRDSNGRMFMDNVRLVRVKELKYLVKKSLSVDPVCDSVQSDNLPGEALGCSAYKDPTTKSFYLTGFSYLCRKNAIGCTTVTETYNTPSDKEAKAYNVRLTGAGGTTQEVEIGSDTYKCIITVGDTGCYVNITGHTYGEIKGKIPNGFVTSTVYIPADSSETKPIYLVANKEGSCNQIDLGCTMAGMQQLTPAGLKFTTTTIKNDPALYETALCRNEAVGCNAFSDGTDTRFFKDPAVLGQKVCTYRENVRINGVERSGWFWKGAGVCSNMTATKYCSKASEAADCGSGSTCEDIDDKPCYPNYLNNGKFGVWSSGNTSTYDNFVGECPAAQNKCTEFLDPKNNSQPYYFIKDNSISEGDCSSQVSQKFGCALFNQTDNPNKFFNSSLLYAESDRLDGKKVSALENNNPGNDSNIIIKVARDRVCGEWLGCTYTRSVFDKSTGNFKEVCENVRRCDGTSCGPHIKSEYSGEILSDDVYRRREIGWLGRDYSGYSLHGLYPIEELTDVNFAPKTADPIAPDWRLVKKVPCGDLNCTNSNKKDSSCKNSNPDNGSVECGYLGSRGVCINNVCVRDIEGDTTFKNVKDASPKQICRGYPEVDAPFPMLTFVKDAETIYGRANKCSESTAGNGPDAYLCDCDYTKVSFSNAVTKYWSYENPLSKNGISMKDGTKITNLGDLKGLCVGGAEDGLACSFEENECKGGACQRKDSTSKVLGLKGYCLEYDTRSILFDNQADHPCLTWFPGKLNGVADLFNQYVDAGFDLAAKGYEKGPFYCKDVELWKKDTIIIKNVMGYVDCDGKLADYETSGGNQVGVGYVKDVAAQIAAGNAPLATVVLDNITGINVLPFSNGVKCTNSSLYVIDYCDARNDDPSTYLYRADSDYSTGGKRMECPAGYQLGKVTNMTASSMYCSPTDGLEDKVTIDYECVNQTAKWVKAQNQPNPLPTVLQSNEELRCTSLVQISDIASELVGMTQELWKKNDSCLLGSSSYATDPQVPSLAVITSEEKCSLNKQYKPAEADKPALYYGGDSYDKNKIDFIGKNYFAKSSQYWLLNTSIGNGRERYDKAPSVAGAIWDVRYQGTPSAKIIPPKILSVESCEKNKEGKYVCLEGNEGLTIFANNQFYSGNETIELTPENPVANMSFFAFASNNQMPIRKIAIDWGDGSDDTYESGDPSFYRNLRGARNGTCNPTAYDGKRTCEVLKLFEEPRQNYSDPRTPGYVAQETDIECKEDADCKNIELCKEESPSSQYFGLLKNKTCITGTFQFKNHYYQCLKDGFGWQEQCDGYPNGCCVFRPKAHVKDNWGWCTGTDDCDNNAGGGCYDGGGKTENFCNIHRGDGEKAWVNYGGKVIVEPAK